MVSALWNACAADVEDVSTVAQLLKEGVDLEIKDQTGTTPLIQAVRNGHKDIVKALVAAGADINNASSHGKPETFTTDPDILALLQPKAPSSDPSTPYDPAMQHYYYPMPGHDGPYPYPYPIMSDGQMPPFPQGENAAGNLPPADVARTIPCRYFPVCRYGSSCMFLHPPAGYFSGPPPAPAHYPPIYPPHPYYMMRPGAYPPPPPPASAPVDPASSPVTATQPFPPAPISYPPPPNGAPPFSPATNGAPFPPPVNGAPFPNGAPYPPPANGAPYPPPTSNGTPFSPVSTGTPYTPATNGTPSPYGPPPFSPGTTTPYSAGAPFTPGPVPVPYGYPRPYPDTPKEAPVNGAPNGTTEETQPAPTTNGVNGTGHHPNSGFARRGRGGRRESFGTQRQQKPPCLFFPLGRCRNGDECRFPHVPAEPGSQPNNFRYPNNNNRFNGGHRARHSVGHHDGPPPAHIPPGTKLPFAPGSHGQAQNQTPNAQQQRVPNADDFPVLKGGSGQGTERPAVPPTANSGLTAAQVLQAPAPAKKGKADSEVVGDLADAFSKVHVNGLAAPAFEAASTPEITAVGA